MKCLALVCIVLVAVISSNEANAFKMPSNWAEALEQLKKVPEKMKDLYKEHMKSKALDKKAKSTVESAMHDIASKIMKEHGKISKVTDVNALKGFIKHLMFVHLNKTLAMKDRIKDMTMKTLKTVEADLRRSNDPAVKSFNMSKMMGVFSGFMEKKHGEWSATLKQLLQRHKINLSPEKIQHILHRIIPASVLRTPVFDEMQKALKEVHDKPIAKETLALMKTEVESLHSTHREQMKKDFMAMLKNLKLPVSEEKIVQAFAKMTEHFKKMKSHWESGEEALKEHANEAMALLHKAFMHQSPEQRHKAMEIMRSMIPAAVEQKLRDLKDKLEKEGWRVSGHELRKLMRDSAHPPGEKEICFYPAPERKRVPLWVMIAAPIGGLVLLIIIAVVIYLCVRRRRRPKCDGEPALPSKRANPYGHLEEDTRSVTA